MNSVANGCDFSDLHPGDEVEFLITFSQKAQKNSASYVKKLRYMDVPRLVKHALTFFGEEFLLCDITSQGSNQLKAKTSIHLK